MLARRIIPCLDVKDGRVVKGVSFVDLVDAGDPVQIAAAYDEAGADEVTFLDIAASHEGRDTILDVVRHTAEQVFIPLTVGGGVREVADIRRLLQAGADKVGINTAAVENPKFVEEASRAFGSQCIVVAVDAKRRNPEDASDGWEVYTHGGRKARGIDAIKWVQQMEALGAGEILLTSMDQDGQQSGYDNALNRAASDVLGIPLIASGGVGELSHLYDGLTEGGADAVLAASIFHFGTYTVAETKKYLAGRDVLVRI